jgi:hypothetical protein
MFWLGAAVAAISLLISFVWPQRTLRIRLALFALGLVGLGATAYRYIGDQQERAAIEQKLAPRALTDQHAGEITQAIKPFAGQKFQMITYPNCAECTATFLRIYYILTSGAGWIREGPPVAIPIGAMSSVLIGAMSSVLINVSDGADERTKAAGRALATALNDNGIVSTPGNDTADTAIVDIIIGLKP